MVAGQDVGLGLGIIDIDLRGGALADEIVETAKVALRALELRLVLGEHALGLFDLGVDLAAIEREQQIAFVDLGAVLEMHRDDGGFQPRFQRHAGDRRHHPDRVDIDGHGFALRLGEFNRNHARALRPLGVGAAAHPRGAGNKTGRRKDRDGADNEYQATFFHVFSRSPVLQGRDGLLQPLDGDFCALFVNGYHSLDAHGMPLKGKMCSYNSGSN